MPLYDFKGTCGHTFDALSKPDVTIPCRCGTPGCTAERLLGAPGFRLKGEGYSDKGRPVAGAPPGHRG